MEDVLLSIGLTAKQATMYLRLLEEGSLTATELAAVCHETRTNTYALVSELVDKGLVIIDTKPAVRRYRSTDPRHLLKLVQTRIDEQRQAAAALQVAMPRLRAQFALSSDKPGVVQMAGLEGFKALLEDMARSTSEVLLVASDVAPSNSEHFEVLLKGLAKRQARGVATRALFHHAEHDQAMRETFVQRGIDVRFVGQTPFTGEVVLYEENVVFTVYEPSLIVTIVTDDSIADTMRNVFQLLWDEAALAVE